jgi:23S rRNA (cytosine1962-C5)-methyltransferase
MMHRVTVDEEAARAIRRGRPWVFREALAARIDVPLGAWVEMVDARGGHLGQGLVEPRAAIVVRVLSRAPRRVELRALLEDRLHDAFALRMRLLAGEAREAYRLCNGEGDGLSGLAIDVYGEYAVVELTSAAWAPHRDHIVDTLRALSPSFRGILEKSRLKPGRDGEVVQHLWGDEPPEIVWVGEWGARYAVELRGTSKSGLFLDQRETRRALLALCAEARSALNVFSFTGSLSVAMAKGGARSVTSIDLSRPALERARRNFEGNALDASAHTFTEANAFEELPRLAREGRRFDIVVLDPPAFSQSKSRGPREKRTFQAERDYAELVSHACRILRPGGVLVASTPMAALPLAGFERSLADGAARAGRRLSVFDARSQPADFPVDPACPEKRHLKVLFALCRGTP